MSIKGNIYKAIADYLMATLNFQEGNPTTNPYGLQPLRWVDLNRNQFDTLDQQLGIPFPAILVRFASADWVSASQQVQDGQQVLVFDIGYENYAASYEGSADQDEALKYLQFQEEVYKALQGLQGSTFTALQRVADEDDEDKPGGLLVSRMMFVTNITDTSAQDTNRTVVTDVDTRVQYQEGPLPTGNRIQKDFIIPPRP